MTIQEMKELKKELGYSNELLSELSGVPLDTIRNIFSGTAISPQHNTLLALETVLKEEYKYSPSMISESTEVYLGKKQGEYTLEDYYAIPDEHRVELIDGVIYDMSSPTSAHQLIAGFIHARLLSFTASQKGNCLPMISPIDVQLDKDNKTIVQPDVIIVCNLDKVINRCIYGAPDFVIEILSPSTRKKDMVTKLDKYMNAGVREYWMIDPEKKKVMVYDFEHDNYPVLYGFDSKVPVGIWENACAIDFNEVYDYIRFLYKS